MKITFTMNNKTVTLNGFEDDHISKVIQDSSQFYEQEMLDFIAGLEPKGTIIDVGANIGNHSVFFGMFTSAKEVLAIEPFEKVQRKLSQNITANGLSGHVRQINSAAGATVGSAKILPAPSSNYGMTRVVAGEGVDVITLDDLVLKYPVSVIKIDVEGGEVSVLMGAIQILAKDRPELFIEAADELHKQKIDTLLAGYGYSSRQQFNWTPTYWYSTK